MENSEKITLSLTREQYDDMVYCMNTVKKMRERALDHYYKNKTHTSVSKKRKIEIPIPQVVEQKETKRFSDYEKLYSAYEPKTVSSRTH